ncbi:TetR/AcrR family transcriptional regulator [Promicromonospora thailandica]|uniref:Transcriptional regulator, TetR family n=1 Tax=Promicromonospora thailandica TaxID=765201 RepID=A0A9X2G7F0_9MICO|nr:TetR/AcrR family transcriptional regulator [Promicromonospora thailandica]MCP2267113.1 transcriptional regulator, TetR family [Promicromonospora thailandica]BFF16597.1 TetR family transcriptional regulator C-terminal domain-containing protein [Promicromonospora thailandica]
MPKRVDPDARREQVADAVIDEIAEHGLRAVTLARIAARSGLAIGSIRHYFGDTLREVMRFTLDVLVQRALRRAETLSDDPVARIAEAIAFAAPTTDQERKENAALVEYRVMGRTDPELAAEITATSAAGAETIRSLLGAALTGRVIDEETLHREALLLFALVEGLSFSSALHSAPLREADVRTMVTASVNRLREACPPAPAAGHATVGRA